MSVTKYSLLVLLMVIALGSSEAVQFPGLALVSDCIDTKCGVRIRSCLRANQWEITKSTKGCIASQCRNALKLCVKELPNDVFAAAKAMAEIVEEFIDVGFDAFSDSYLQCWLDRDIFNGTQLTDCVIDDLLKTMEPYITLIGSMVFSDPVYMACWMVQVGRAFVSVVVDAQEDHKYSAQMELNKAAEADRNLYEYLKCIGTRNTNDEKCVDLWNRVLGTPQWMKQKSKGMFTGCPSFSIL
ncbi:hypothetical protein ACEWY4_000575 [Coilia grayii]|uniref:Uncharacterized protein n=1 Tax=Coilia grayii TaxID=363190 RepID=A0ABD1KX28_9TELE